MIRVVFKNMESSELTKFAVVEKLKPFMSKFPDLRAGLIHVTVEMHNSPAKAGQDLYSIKAHIHGGRYHGVRLEKSSAKLHAALSEISDHLLEKLNRYGDRIRVKQRSRERRLSDTLRVRFFPI